MIRIARRFRGPTSSGNGGYTAGLLAELVAGAPAVTVTLRRPPPLEVDLATAATPGGWLLRHGDDVVAEAVGADLTAAADPVAYVDVATAQPAEDSYPGLRHHPFPECFVCGPARDPGDGLRLFPGRLRDGHTACTWTPDASLGDPDGRVAPEYVWAALDCPGGWTGDLEGRPMVLGRISATLPGPVVVGDTYVVVGRLLGSEGRKTFTASTVYDSAGHECGRASHTWIHVDPSQFR